MSLTYEQAWENLNPDYMRCDCCGRPVSVKADYPAIPYQITDLAKLGIAHSVCCGCAMPAGSNEGARVYTAEAACNLVEACVMRNVRPMGAQAPKRDPIGALAEVEDILEHACPTVLCGAPDPWKHRSDGMSCKTCMWYVRKESGAPTELGRCRRHAPTMNGYPVVFPSDWCGDHKLDETRA